MVLAKDPQHSSVLHIDSETFDCRPRAASKSHVSQLLHMEQDVSVYHSTDEYLYFSLQDLISQYHILVCIYTLIHITQMKKVQTVIKKHIVN
jgi:hypothetical protein